MTGSTAAPGPDPSDRDLVHRARAGDHAAFAELISRHERRVHALTYRMLGRQEDARDAAQEAFLACYRNLDRFREDAAFSTWLHRIAVNACYDILRRRGREPVPHEVLPEPPPAGDPGDRMAAAVDVQRALLAVAPEFRAVLVLHDAQGIPVDEVAAALGIPVGTVKSRLHRGRVALGRILAGEPRAAPSASNPTSPLERR